MGHKIIGRDLDSFAFNNVFQGLVHQIIIKSIYKNRRRPDCPFALVQQTGEDHLCPRSAQLGARGAEDPTAHPRMKDKIVPPETGTKTI